MHKNFKSVEKTVFGRGSYNQLGSIIDDRRNENDGFAVFLVDDYFDDKPLGDNIPSKEGDMVFFVDVQTHEPTTQQVDIIRDEILKTGLPAVIIGIGGGSAMDIAKATSLMVCNEGSSTLYQGLNLVKNPGVFAIGVPTISGTGAEVSMTAVLTGPEKKLGLKCEWTVFNQIILDPDLIADVPTNQWFYTGMDNYIHCIESENGIFNNAYSKAYGEESLKLCRDVFLGENAGQTPENDEKLMVASLMGGLSLTYSEVGVCHALSYGLSYVFETRHGLANCICFNQLEDYYGEGVVEFKEMVKRFNIEIPSNLAKDWSEDEITAMATIAIRLEHMWHHAFGADWKEKINLDLIKDLYRRM
jgi:3-deoxy-alpha-D-manno-octulosonate 8-oxidase